MAGHFVLSSITISDLQTAISKGCVWSPLMHAQGANIGDHRPGARFPGWTEGSRELLRRGLTEGLVGARDNLPPHRYLRFGPIAPDENTPLSAYIKNAGWAETVTRPNLGLVELCSAANALFPANPGGAVMAQARHGAVSIEVYYVSGTRMS